MATATVPAPRQLGARSRQRAALAILAMPVLYRAGMRPSEAMVRSAEWGAEHDVDWRHDFRTSGVARG